jgi:hypothetical protein
MSRPFTSFPRSKFLTVQNDDAPWYATQRSQNSDFSFEGGCGLSGGLVCSGILV